MNKKTLLSIFTLCLITGTIVLNLSHNDKSYSPRVKLTQAINGYADYLQSLKANQITGVIAHDDVVNAVAQIKGQSNNKFKANWPINWEFRGPDNVGGRTRCLVIDKDNPSLLYTGGVSGSVFKSENGGGSWYPINLGDDNFGVVSMAQTTDGDLYYGTGENGLLLINSSGRENSGFDGMGIYKSTDGETFTSVAGTASFGNILVLRAHPSQNILFAGSTTGLRYSDDGGDSWTVLRGGSCRDIAISKTGTVMAYVGNSVYRSTDPTTSTSYERVTDIPTSSRAATAWSESDPNFCYIVTVGSASLDGQAYSGSLTGLYKSDDAGITFIKEVGQISQFFAPFTNIGIQGQGEYDMAIAVHPRNENRVFIGGVGFAEWTLENGPRMVGNTFNSPQNPFGLHSDKHYITFDNSGTDPIMYVCSDGGVARTTDEDLSRYKDLSTGLISTQFFAVDADLNGRIIGGTQDNNTILITGESYPRNPGIDILGGDGFECAFSEFNTDILFGESQYGNLRRSVTSGSSMGSIWDNRITASFQSNSRPTGYFNNPLCLWEDPLIVDSVKLRGPVEGEDTLIDSRLYYAMDDGIWMCQNALSAPFEPNVNKDGSIRWFRISSLTNVHYIETTVDGSSLFIGTNSGRVYRIDSLLTTQFDTISLPAYNQIAANLNQTNITGNMSISGRVVTSIAIDESNASRLVISLGNYGNTNYVYTTNDALVASPTWNSIHGTLPDFPVYHALISVDDPDIIILGTEFGVWATNNGTSTNPTWGEALDGIDTDRPMPRVPVFDITQVENKTWSGPRIYAGTHGMGVWESKSLLTGVPKLTKNETTVYISAYPNPANNFVNIDTDVKGKYMLKVYGINGQIIHSQEGTNIGLIKIATDRFNNGNYFVEVIGDGTKAVSKIIVQH
ncbi:MAG: hypothetical protein COA58_08340 [Bacteroidetes bacterium]|nr:MAG: hypothetical protein COA58_08340 [Bacteroidota bacterium]